ncbi:hypothetical protein CPTAKMNP4_073 [Salmonella phage vB_SenM-AKM_NP4]|uniref:Uncharacterized protein n=1 Tax=Salmonella phage S16 TaxID=1087482 RepID=M1HDH2_BPS16|nr:hypothetical protein I133_gp199 [Salmonella phage vB_SenM-S16]AGE48156.1 hypothetical protein [Salmonella phage vB_SenM-S16]WDR21739.1 hypothetical protein PJM34_0071 [Salmonella phage vB_SenM_UTK0003]WLI71698.1 hypothetical protein CPTAKMNP4_073 [Salmonella phage vB_SenM-AKM_NP4]
MNTKIIHDKKLDGSCIWKFVISNKDGTFTTVLSVSKLTPRLIRRYKRINRLFNF